MRPPRIVLAASALGLLASACGRSETPPPQPPPAARTGPAGLAPAAAADAAKNALVGALTLRRGGLDGQMSDPSESFTAGDAVLASMKVDHLSPGTEVKLIWYGPGDSTLAEETLKVPTGAQQVSFNSKVTSSWKPGEYRVEVVAGGASAGSKKFTLLPPG